MQKWTVQLSLRAYKQLKKLPAVVQDLVDEVLYDLESFGFHPLHWDNKKIAVNSYRIRLNYRYRLR